MKVEVGCREIWGDCDFIVCGESKQDVLYRIMRHIQEEHTDDWFSIEEIYADVCALIQRKVA
jgi:predicted small metal-binding protein